MGCKCTDGSLAVDESWTSGLLVARDWLGIMEIKYSLINEYGNLARINSWISKSDSEYDQHWLTADLEDPNWLVDRDIATHVLNGARGTKADNSPELPLISKEFRSHTWKLAEVTIKMEIRII
jgi:hypothetical protein